MNTQRCKVVGFITDLSGFILKVIGLDSEIRFILDKLILPRQSKPEMPNGL